VIVLSAGMQKAGTAWYFNLTNDLLVAAGHADVRRLRSQFRLQRFMTAANCNIGRPTTARMLAVGLPHLLGKTYVVKTHESPTAGVAAATKLGMMRASYIYRDPRDVVVSVYEHGERIRSSGADSATGFDKLETVESAIEFVAERLKSWRAWVSLPGTLIVRYEHLRADPLRECERLVGFLGLTLPADAIPNTVHRYSAERASAGDTPHPLHFHRGTSGRWRERLTPAQAEQCERRFADYLVEMGLSA
jgi:hypothetical protein